MCFDLNRQTKRKLENENKRNTFFIYVSQVYMIRKTIILKVTITAKYIEYKHIGTKHWELLVVSPFTYSDCSVWIQLQNVENSIIKIFFWTLCWNMKSVSQVSLFNWVRNEVLISLILEKDLWIRGKLDLLMHVKNILWKVTTLNYTIYQKKNIRAYTSFKSILFKFFV